MIQIFIQNKVTFKLELTFISKEILETKFESNFILQAGQAFDKY